MGHNCTWSAYQHPTLFLLIIILTLAHEKRAKAYLTTNLSLPTSCLELWLDQDTGQYCKVTNGILEDSLNAHRAVTKGSLQFSEIRLQKGLMNEQYNYCYHYANV